ncbi:MAG: hypothetical protein M3N50_07180, partial [Pseudomonadota bacterium]|nr:hypothetical protein [Pseudomonadota bacterium]
HSAQSTAKRYATRRTARAPAWLMRGALRTNCGAVYIDAKHRDEMVPSFNGHSIAHWEGKTLVIATVGLREETLEFMKLPHSPQLRVIERLHARNPTSWLP